MCVLISTCMHVYLTVNVCSPSCKVLHKYVCPWVILFAWARYPFSACTPWSECVHASVHVCMSTQLPMLAQHPMDSYMETWISLCGSVCVCPSHPASGQTPWLECVHASIHIYICTWLPMSTPCPMHSLMETWVPLCGIVCLSQSPYSIPLPWLECVHALVQQFMSTWLHMSAQTLCIVWWKPGCPCMSVCLCPSHPASGQTPWLECVHAPLHEIMSTWLPMLAQPPMDS